MQAQAWEEERPGEAAAGGFDGEPELHRQRQGKEDNGRRRVHGRSERPDALESDRDREDEHGKICAASRGEPGRLSRTPPGLGEAPFLGGSDRPVLGAVQSERAAAEEPDDERERERQSRDERSAMREEGEHEGGRDRDHEQQRPP